MSIMSNFDPNTFYRCSLPTGRCNHGCPDPLAAPGMQAYYNHFLSSHPAYTAQKMHEAAPILLNSMMNAKSTIQTLVAIGTNLLRLEGSKKEQGIFYARKTAMIIFMLETVAERVSGRSSLQQIREGNWVDNKKKLVDIFANRLDCDCLVDEKAAVQNDKTGRCSLCGKHSEDSELFECSSCKVVKYCGEECQRKHWNTGHKSFCREVKKELLRKELRGASERT